jgi:hypothetical protein
MSSSKPKVAPSTIKAKAKPPTAFLTMPKVLYIADSVGHTASLRQVEMSQNCRIKTAKAYSSDYDVKARWPKSNFTDVAKYALENSGKEKFDVLVMSAPTVDITNLDTTRLQKNDNTEFFQQQAYLSSQNMIKVAERSIQNNPSLTKVVIKEHPPRFDTSDVDPTSLKHNLVRLANATLGQLWLNSTFKDKICIGRHSLESPGVGASHDARYLNNRSGKYDGVHLYGRTASVDYTNSVKTIMLLAIQEKNITNGFGTAQGKHDECEQAKYQKKNNHSSVHTSNRFNVLNQGNC